MRREAHRSLWADFIYKTCSHMGFSALLIHVFEKTSSTLELGYISAAMLLPAVLFSFSSGWVVHGLSAVWTYRISQTLRGGCFIGAAFATDGVWVYTAVAALTSFLHQVGGTAKLAYDADLIPAGERVRFNSKRAFFGSIGLVIGPSLGGLISGRFSSSWALIATGLLTLVGALLLMSLPADRVQAAAVTEQGAEGKQAGLLDAWNWLKHMPELLLLVCTYITVVAILEMEAPLIFPFVEEVYRQDSHIAGYLLGVGGLGGLAGSLAMARHGKPLAGWMMALLLAVDGLLLLLVVAGFSLPATFVIFTLLGVISVITLVTVETEVQERTPRPYQPYLFAVLTFAGGVGGAALTLISTRVAASMGAASVLRYCALFEIALGLTAAVIFRGVLARKRAQGPGA